MLSFEKEMRFTGSHASKIRELVSWKFFDSYVEVVPIAAILGFLNSRKAPANSEMSESDAKIQTDQLVRHESKVNTAFALVTLCSPDSGESFGDRANEFFRSVNPTNEQKLLFESYVRGGIDYLYDILVEKTGRDPQKIALEIRDFCREVESNNSAISVEDILKLTNPRD
jgi:hypothetical protein